MDFKKYYKFPLKFDILDYYKVFDRDNEMAFDFPMAIDRKINLDLLHLSEEERIMIVEYINGTISMDIKINAKMHYDPTNTTIYVESNKKRMDLIVLRGRGHLTGIGGLNLPGETADKIQRSLAEFIIKKLSY